MLLNCGMPSGKEVGITASSVSELEWSSWVVMGDVGKRGWGVKVLDNTASLLLVMLLKAHVLPILGLLSPGHSVLWRRKHTFVKA